MTLSCLLLLVHLHHRRLYLIFVFCFLFTFIFVVVILSLSYAFLLLKMQICIYCSISTLLERKKPRKYYINGWTEMLTYYLYMFCNNTYYRLVHALEIRNSGALFLTEYLVCQCLPSFCELWLSGGDLVPIFKDHLRTIWNYFYYFSAIFQISERQT